jgi:hypothetical protein
MDTVCFIVSNQINEKGIVDFESQAIYSPFLYLFQSTLTGMERWRLNLMLKGPQSPGRKSASENRKRGEKGVDLKTKHFERKRSLEGRSAAYVRGSRSKRRKSQFNKMICIRNIQELI